MSYKLLFRVLDAGLLVGCALAAETALAQPEAIAEAYSRVAAYKPGTTTVNDFVADKWSVADAWRGKVGVVAARAHGGKGQVEFIMGTCGNIRDPILDQIVNLKSVEDVVSLDRGLASAVDLFWPDGPRITPVRCDKKFHLLFVESVLRSLEPLPTR